MLPARPQPASEAARLHLIAYDIRDKARLAKMGRACGKAAFRLHDSLYCAELGESALRALCARLLALIDPATDDLRFYPVPQTVFGGWHGPDPETFCAEAFLLGSEVERFLFSLKRQNANMKRT